MECDHVLDKNLTHCIKCGMKVIKKEFVKATKAQQKLWRENPQKFMESLKTQPRVLNEGINFDIVEGRIVKELPVKKENAEQTKLFNTGISSPFNTAGEIYEI